MTEWLNKKEFVTDNKIEKLNNNHLEVKKGKIHHISKQKIYGKEGNDTHLNYIQEITKILSKERADSYSDWLHVGILLHNIDYRLKDSWIDFSKKSPKYVSGECEQKWECLPSKIDTNKKDNNNSELGFGSLIRWAKQDNPEEYLKLYNKHNTSLDNNTDLYKKIIASFSLTQSDIAEVLYKYFNGSGFAEEIKFVCMNSTKGYFANFREDLHRWEEDDDNNAGSCIRATFDNELLNLYNVKFKSQIMKRMIEATENGNTDEIERLEEYKKKIDKVVHLLKLTSQKILY